METTAIRLQVPRNVYEKLVTEQKNRRHDAGRKTSLADIIIEFCENGLEYLQSDQNNDQNNVRNNDHLAQNNDHSDLKNVRNSSIKTNIALPDTCLDKRFKQWEEYLMRWEGSLREKESFIKEKENELFDEKEEVFNMRNELLEQKDNLRQEALSGPEKIVEIKIQAYELENKKKRINELEHQLGEVHGKFQKALQLAETRKETPTFWDEVKKYLPIIIGGAGILGTYLLSRKSEKPKLDPHLTKIAEVFDQLNQNDKQKLGTILLNAAEMNTSQAVENKENSKPLMLSIPKELEKAIDK
jgi:hypothetical protein